MIYIVLPAYNEELTLPPLLEAISENLDEAGLKYTVIIVNDGSTDATQKKVETLSKKLPIVLINHATNRGLPEAIKTGLLKAIEASSEKDIIVTMDSDNTHTPGLILRMLRMVREGHDVVIASRNAKGARVIGVPFNRRILSFAASIIFRLFFPIHGVKDYTCGYRAYRAEVINNMFNYYGETFIDEPGFSCMVDILLKIRKYPVIIGEVPLILRYDKKDSASKMDIKKTIKQTLKLIVKRRFNIY
jgi:dolichol-phosphate mannosyltransferase